MHHLFKTSGLFVVLLLCLSAPAHVNGQSTAYQNPYLAKSNWPIYHANTSATASSVNTGPGDIERVQVIDSLTQAGFGRRNAPHNRLQVSPWTVMMEPYPDGTQAVITTPNDGVAKYIIRDDQLESVHFLKLDRRTLDFDWGILMLSDGRGIVTEQKKDRFVIFGDERAGDPTSPLEIKAYIDVSERRYGDLNAHFSIAPDGTLIALTEKNKLIAIDIEARAVVAEFDLPSEGGTSFHNSFPIDKTGRIFLSTQNMMAAIDWHDGAFKLAWTALYDMRGPGCEDVAKTQSRRAEILAVARGKTCTGSGTTPTLLGDPDTGVVVIVDGHSPQNNLIAFWRNAPPATWAAIADPIGRSDKLDVRIAGVLPLPYSTPDGDGFTAENSPAAMRNGVVIAQWAGFRPGPDSPRGVQRVDWNHAKNTLELKWANPAIHFNGVPTIACQQIDKCKVYGMGRYGRNYGYRAVDFDTGEVTSSLSLGTDRDVLDQGNNHAVANDGSIVYSGRFKMVRIK